MRKRANGCLNEMGELPKVCALIRIIAFEYKMHKHGILTPPKTFKHTKCERKHIWNRGITLATHKLLSDKRR